MQNIERLQFADKFLALDVNGAAGVTAKVIGAVLGKTQVLNPSYMGIGLGFEATAEQKAPYIKMLAEGMKAGDLVVLAADTPFNTNNINLVGLAQTGIEYLPVV